MGGLMENAKKLQAQHNRYKSAKGKIEKVEGIVDDVRKLRTFASHLMHGRAGSSSTLLKLSYEGMGRLAGLLPTPYLSHYLQYSQPGIDALARLWSVRDETQIAQKWFDGIIPVANDFDKAISEIVSEFSYAGPMVDRDGRLNRNLPRKFMAYFEQQDELRSDFEEYRGVASWRDANSPPSKIDTAHIGQAGLALMAENTRLGMAIAKTARDIAASHKYFAAQYAQTVAAGNKASKTMKRLLGSTNPIDFNGGASANYAMQLEAVARDTKKPGTLRNDELVDFVNGRWKRMPAFKKMERAMEEMETLSRNWYIWTIGVKDGSHMSWY